MKRKIFVIDDDPMVLFIHEAILDDSDLIKPIQCFLSAGAALEALDEYKDMQTQFLFLLDINMPVMTGWQMLDELTKYPRKENILVVMVTSSVNESDEEKAHSYELVTDYLSKPIGPRSIERLRLNKRLSGFFQMNAV